MAVEFNGLLIGTNITMEKSAGLKCNQCLALLPLCSHSAKKHAFSAPMPVWDLLTIIIGFISEHRDCAPVELIPDAYGILNATERIRFWSKVNPDGPLCESLGTKCWIWTGTIRAKDSYGAFTLTPDQRNATPKMPVAHKVAYLLKHGSIPSGLDLDHLCRVRACVNPGHLEAVTRQVNLNRSPLTPSARTACPQGHPYDEANTIITQRGRRCRACDNTRHVSSYYSTRQVTNPRKAGRHESGSRWK